MREISFNYKIEENYNNVTLEAFLKSYYLGKDSLNRLIYNNKVKVNEVVTNRKDITLKEGDIVSLSYDINPIIPYDYNISIIYEDEYIVAVNKPANMLIHSDGNTSKTLRNAVYKYCLKTNKNPYVYPIHRIDYETMGIVIFAKDPLSLSFLSCEIEQNNCKKTYTCLCEGKFTGKRGIINKPIGRDRHSNKMIVIEKGKEAQTSYEVLNNGTISKLKVNIKQGRTHQIRVHLSSVNHPIVGDKIYGKGDDGGLKLHFCEFEFTHPYSRNKIIIKSKEEF